MANPSPDTSGLNAASRCSRLRKRDREPCRAYAVRGTDPPACRKHLGRKVAEVRAEEAAREAARRWGLPDADTDPGELLLQLVAQAAIRANSYAVELERLIQEAGDVRKALTADKWATTEAGDQVKTGEYIRAMAQLEAAERDRASSFAARAVAVGLSERQIKLAEKQADMAADFVNAVLADLGLAGTPQAQEAIRRHLALIRPAA